MTAMTVLFTKEKISSFGLVGGSTSCLVS